MRDKAKLQPGERIIGMVARLAAEKGVEFLMEAMSDILKKHPTARVLHVGQYQDVMGEEEYTNKLQPMIKALGDRWTFLGILSPPELAAFYRLCEVTVLPSTNSTESFGIVQVESMSCGTPVVASDIPGVRIPIKMTGMGQLAPPANAQALAESICEVLEHPECYQGDPDEVMKRFSPVHIAEEYEAVFQEVVRSSKATQ
jgi:glycosyltransferase involved in cell wall biosynthesis